MSYYITPVLGLTLPNPGTGQTFETPVVNNDFVLLENGISADRTRLGILEAKPSFKSTSSVFNVFDPAARNSLPASNGDLAFQRNNGRIYRWDGINAAWRSTGGLQQCQPTYQFASNTVSVTNGRTSFVNSTYAGMDGVFTDEFDTYEIFIEEFGAVHSSFLRWRSGGVELGTGYINQQTVKNGTIVGSQPNGTQMPLATQANTQKSTKITLFKARTAGYSKTACALTMEAGASMAVTEVESNAGSAAIDGFTIYFSTGTNTGTIDVFGYNTRQAQ